jgi:hypothetical protein
MPVVLPRAPLYRVISTARSLGFDTADTIWLSFVAFDPSISTIPVRRGMPTNPRVKGAGYLHVAQPPFDLGAPVLENLVIETPSMAKPAANSCLHSPRSSYLIRHGSCLTF